MRKDDATLLGEHRLSWIVVLVAGTLLGVGSVDVHELWAQQTDEARAPGQPPVTSSDVQKIQHRMTSDQVAGTVGQRLIAAIDGAVEATGCHLIEEGLDPARRSFYAGRHDEARTLALSYLKHAEPNSSCPLSDESAGAEGADAGASGSEGSTPAPSASEWKATRKRARILAAHAALELDAPRETLDELAAFEPGATPVDDYILWLRARAWEELDRPGKAADTYWGIRQLAETPLRPRARARQALMSVEAGRWKESLPRIDKMLEQFPDYPRRHRLLFGRAEALEQLGRFDEAAEAYQSTWYAYPHKPVGDLALAHLERLKLRGIEPAPLAARKLFRRYRQLRIHRQWTQSETLFRRLLDRVSTAGGHSEFEHEILTQLALANYQPKDNEEALHYLHKLRRAWEAGQRDGIHIHVVDKYLARTHSRMGRYDLALAAQKRRLKDHGSYHRRREMLDFYEEHGRYEEAYQLAKSYYSKWHKRHWRYTWLLYKTGRFEEALENLERMVKFRDGDDKAKALYWSARSHERAGSPQKATEIYREIAREYTVHYYGIQAVNRLRDLRQRETVDGAIAEKTESVLDSGDEVFTAFENAAEAMSDRPRDGGVDPTLVPKRADAGRTPAVKAADCEIGTRADTSLCRLLTGDVPDGTLRAIEGALTPFRSPNGLIYRGMNALNVDGREDSEPGETSEPTADVSPEDVAERPDPKRIDYPTRARIYWEGRHDSEVAFARYADGETIGPMPDAPRAYTDRGYIGATGRAAEAAGELFPEMRRARWLYDTGMVKAARTAIRDVALEFRALSRRPKAGDGDPHELPHHRWAYLVDYRRYGKGFWGWDGDGAPRYPVPDSTEGKEELADRQQKIWSKRDELKPLLVEAMREVGDYHLVRQFALERGGWYRDDPSKTTRHLWTRAYPRAYPRKVLEEAKKNAINPYLIWSLMAVESAYNPDSISPADAIGLLQVIPRTGIKVATWIGDDDFGSYDLIDEHTAIEQGTRYFGSLVRKFEGQELLAIIGYNGGPHRVADWMEKRGGMPMDEFVEEVPFGQARHYVKKVIRRLNIYLQIYEGRQRLYIGQNVSEEYRPQPNF